MIDAAGGVGHAAERFHQRHASRHHGRQGAAGARHRGVGEDAAGDRHAQRRPIQGMAKARRAPVQQDAAHAAADDGQERHPPCALQRLRTADDEARERWQLRPGAGEDLLELRHDVHHQGAADADAGKDHERGIGERLLHFALDGLGALLMAGDAFQHRLQGARPLGNAHQAPLQRVEERRELCQSGRQRRAGGHLVAQAVGDFRHRRARAARDDVERLQQRHAGAQQGRQLAREGGRVGAAHALAELERESRLAPQACHGDAAPPQSGFGEAPLRRLQLAAGLAPGGIGAAPDERVLRHGHAPVVSRRRD